MCCWNMMFRTFGLKWNPQGQMALSIMAEETDQHFHYSNHVSEVPLPACPDVQKMNE